MKNIYKSKKVKILNIQELSHDTRLFTLDINLKFEPGQFVIASLPGFGESALSLPAKNQLAVRKVGTVTSALHRLSTGDNIYLRGPYGKGTWPQAQKMLIIAGGCGLISMRPLFKNPNNIIFYGIKSKKDLLFKHEHENWPNLHISVEPELVTDLFDKTKLPKSFKACLCGPPAMYKFVIQKLKKLGIPNKDIFVSLERRMSCGTGVCQHCAIGDYYVCKHGPVFSLEKLKNQKF